MGVCVVGSMGQKNRGCSKETIFQEAAKGESISIKEKTSLQVMHSLLWGLGEKSIRLANQCCQSYLLLCWGVGVREGERAKHLPF